MPSPDFRSPDMFGPPPGLLPDEIDVGQGLRMGAEHSNEVRGKLQHLLNYIRMFDENQITDLLGFEHTILSRRTGGIDNGFTGSCLRPRFTIDSENKVSAFWYPVYLLMPGGDGRSLIPMPPSFQGKQLDDQGDTPAADNPMLLSNGDWEAFLRVNGYEAELIIQTDDEPNPETSGPVGDVSVWRLAKWSVEGHGTEDAAITGQEFYACPFLPSIEETAHPFFPFLYRSIDSLKSPGTEVWKAKVWPGKVHDKHTGTVIDVANADGETVIEVADEETWWVEVTTNSEGLPTSAALTKTEPAHQVFQQAEDPSVTGGQGGAYKFKAFTLTVVGGRLVPRIYLGSDIVWDRVLFKNVGDGDGRLYKQLNTTTFQNELRTITGTGDITVTTMGDEIIISYTGGC